MVIASDLDVKDSLTEVFLNHLMEIHIVDKSDIFYKKGRQLASDAYRQVWNTENLIDGNDYGVIISHQGKVIGNINIQISIYTVVVCFLIIHHDKRKFTKIK